MSREYTAFRQFNVAGFTLHYIFSLNIKLIPKIAMIESRCFCDDSVREKCLVLVFLKIRQLEL